MAQREQQIEVRVRELFLGRNGWIQQLEEQKIAEIKSTGGFSLGARPKLAKRFSNALGKNKSLTHLTLDSCDLGDAGVSYVAKALLNNATLDSLSLSNNHVKVKGVSHLAKMLKYNKTLRSLDLSYNDLGDSDIAYFAAGLRLNDRLRNLCLNSNHIGDTGTADLADSLAVNHGLVELRLRANRIGKIGAQYLSDALKVNKNLGILDLGGNNIGDTGAESLAIALLENQTLCLLNIDWNNISDKGIVGFSTALETNQTLTVLCTWGNQFDEFGDPAMYQYAIERILKRNKTAKEKQFLETLNSEESATWNRSRLMFVGQGRAGKTATAFVAEWDSTIGADISEVRSTREKGEWRKDSLNNKTDSVSSSFAARIMLGMGKSQALAHCDRKHGPTSQETKYDKKEVLKEVRSAQNTSCSSETGDAAVSPTHSAGRKKEVIQEYDEELLLNARGDADALVLSLWDFGGQKVFYAMHHLFLTRHGIYLLVFDMREVLNIRTRNAAMKYITFWLSSIRLHAPSSPLLLVGTFLDQIGSETDLREIDNSLREKAKTSTAQIISCDDEDLIFFPVDNEKGFGIIELRLKIEEVARNGSLFNEFVSMRFINLLGELLSAKEKEEKAFLTLPIVKKMANNVGIHDSATQMMALDFFHECGMLIHLTATQALTNMIILKPQWLIDALSKVIRDVDNEQHVHDKDEFDKVGLKSDLDMVSENALASRDFLEYVWEKEHVDFLIDLMRHTMLLSEWQFRNEKLFLIPSLLRDKFNGEMTATPSCIFDFSKGFLPVGVFERLICLVVGHSVICRKRMIGSELREPKLYVNFGSIEFEPGLILNIMRRDSDDLQQIVLAVEDMTRSPEGFVVVQAMLQKLNSDIMGTGLQWDTLFENAKKGQMYSYNEAKKQSLSPWFDKDSDFDVRSDSVESLNADIDNFLESL